MKNKGQAAMEFMMIYGWAIMIVMLAIGALFYFDIGNLDSKMPEQANFPPPFKVIDKAASDNGDITILLRNNLDAQIEILDEGYMGTGGCSNITDFGSAPYIVNPYEEFKLVYTCPEAIENRITSYLSFSYNITESESTYSTTGFVSVNG